MESREKYDLVVVGGGPGGYPAAIRASQLGMKVALIEMNRLGGECTNYGCIPTKALIKPANILWAVKKMGFIKGDIELSFEEYIEWVNTVVKKISGGIEMLLKSYGVDLYRGVASIRDGETIYVENIGELKAKKILLATGTDPADLPGIRVDGEAIHNNRTIIGLKRKPSSILIIGGGYIGVEFASIFAKIGVEVTVIEVMQNLLPGMDPDISRAAERILRSLGVKIYTGTTVKSLAAKGGEVSVELSGGDSLSAEKILVAVGRKPKQISGIEKLGVKLDEKGYIVVDRSMRTSHPNIYASGDIAGPPLLAHKAFAQSLVAAENIAGRNIAFDPKAIPSVIFTDPEIAFVGISENEAKKQGYKARSVKLPLGGVARAAIEEVEEGFAKIVFDEETKEILGFYVVAPHASEIISEAVLAIEMGATLEDLSLTIHPHPTISEVLEEISELALGRPKHFFIRRRSAS
ncbi:MAG: dihydrolipoyl dehydrogenase [Sulfolobales archaeon]